MKTRLNLSIKDSLHLPDKQYVVPSRKENIIVVIEKSDPPSFSKHTDFKKLYYEDQGKKYGF